MFLWLAEMCSQPQKLPCNNKTNNMIQKSNHVGHVTDFLLSKRVNGRRSLGITP